MTSKMGVNRLLKQASNLVMPLTLALEEISKAKNEHGEAVRAFQEKRKPRFTET
jgi:hypothetical protein